MCHKPPNIDKNFNYLPTSQLYQPLPSLTTDYFERADLMKNRKYYLDRFANYPEVVTLPQFCEMLGGIGDSTARKLMRENHVKHYYIRTTYLIPKKWVIDYILGTHYAKYRLKLKAQV